ncbi:hypothetical protein ACLESO_12145 [Pyxidicoccus sp. 3LG]
MRDILQLAFKEYRWFQPAPDSRFGEYEDLTPGTINYGARLAYYDEVRQLTITDRTEEEFLIISTSRRTEFPFVGRISFSIAVDAPNTAGWRDSHLHQVVELMRRVGSYLAQAGMIDDVYRKEDRFIPNPDGIGTEQTFTLRDPSEGLTGLMWRNFFGPPFIRMFGDRLQLLPPACQRELGNDLVLVQPYELPTQAMTPGGDAAEARLITVLGPECFYDHQQHRKPTRVPELALPST